MSDSTFEVKVVKIDDVQDHPNADRLTVVTVGGYSCIANKHEDGSWRYNAGDLVVYIPEAAVLEEGLLKKMGFWDESKNKGFLSGGRGNRVKAIRLRGTVSQGILFPVQKLSVNGKAEYTINHYERTDYDPAVPELFDVVEGQDVAEYLEIVKWSPAIPAHLQGSVTGGMLGYTKSFDLDSAQKKPEMFNVGEEIVVTEKLHGTQIQIGILNDAPEDMHDKLFKVETAPEFSLVHAFVTSKGQAKKGIIQQNAADNASNIYVAAYNKYIAEVAGKIAEQMNVYGAPGATWRLFIFGEVLGAGVQDLTYGKDGQVLRVFDVFIEVKDTDGTIIEESYLDDDELEWFCEDYNVQRCPVLHRGHFTCLKDLDEYRDGPTVEGDRAHVREGIVIKAAEERTVIGLPSSRMMQKYVSPDYLLRKNGSEFN